MPDQRKRLFPMAEASMWLNRIFAMVIVMVLPVILGFYLDEHFGTGWIIVIGLLFGPISGIAYLLLITRKNQTKKKLSESKDKHPPTRSNND